MLLLLFLLLLVRGASSADCICSYQNQTYDSATWPTFFIQNPFDGDKPCAGNCIYFLDSGDPSKGIGNFQIIQWEQISGASNIVIYNVDKNGNPILSDPPVSESNSNQSPNNFKSSSFRVMVNLTMTGEAHILATLVQTSQQVPTTTTLAPVQTTTTSYSGPMRNDPASMSYDILFMVDGGANGQQNSWVVFNESKQLAAAIVESFRPESVLMGAANDSNIGNTGSRLALYSLTKLNTGGLVLPWHADIPTVSGLIKGLPLMQTIPSSYSTALGGVLNADDGPFVYKNPDADYPLNTRAHAQRVIVIVGSSKPSDLDILLKNETTGLFTALDVHPVFIGYKLSDDDWTAVDNLRKQAGWSTFRANDNSAATVNTFLNNYLLSGNTVCNYDQEPITVPEATADEKIVKIPFNYMGAEASDAAWNTRPEKARYCNFQDVTYTFNVANDKTDSICFTAYYELESGKDTLTFRSTNEFKDELVSLTGYDVSGATFSTTGSVTATFKTNSDTVFGGFELRFRKCPPAS